MNRRDFIGSILLASTAGPGAALGAGETRRPAGLNWRHAPKVRVDLPIDRSEQAIVQLLSRHSRQVCEFGGPVVARLAGRKPSWVNLLVEARDFSRVKRELFEARVTTISTPQLPTTFVKFLHGERVYNLMNCGLEEFCQVNRVKSRANLVPFAHNFVVYDLRRKELYDPYDALHPVRSKGQPEMVLMARPRSLPEAFDCILSARFDAQLLGMEPSADVQDFEAFVLGSECPREDLPRIVERAVNYLPDAIELLGLEAASTLALSPLIRGTLDQALGVDLPAVWNRLARAESDAGALFVALVKEGMGTPRTATGYDDDLTLYLARNGFAVRRTDLALESTRVTG